MNAIVEKELPAQMGAIRSGGAIKAVVPQSLDEVFRLAKMISVSGLAPKDMKTPESIAVAMLHGLEIGLKPMQALQRIAVINGRPTLWGDAMLGLVEASGLLEDITESFEGKDDGFKAVCIVKRKGRPSKIIGEFSIGDSKRAGLFGKSGPHTQYRDRMLKMRARSFALRDGFADVLGGMLMAEEAQDLPAEEMRDVTPARPKLSDFTSPKQTDPTSQTEEPTQPSTTETVDTETGEVTEGADYSAADAYSDGAKAKAEGKELTDMPLNLRAFPHLSEAWGEGFQSEAE